MPLQSASLFQLLNFLLFQPFLNRRLLFQLGAAPDQQRDALTFDLPLGLAYQFPNDQSTAVLFLEPFYVVLKTVQVHT